MKASRTVARELTHALHDATCMSEFCEGGDHLKRFRPIVRDVMTADDPVRAIHDRHCPMAHTQTIDGSLCGDNDEHLSRYRSYFQPIIDAPIRQRKRSRHGASEAGNDSAVNTARPAQTPDQVRYDGETVSATDWDAGNHCGNGLHFSATTAQAFGCFQGDKRGSVRFLECSVDVGSMVVLSDDKAKAPSCRVLREIGQI